MRGGMLGLGVILPFAATCLIMWRASVFSKFWFWTFLYAREYGSVIGVRDGLQILWSMVPEITGPSAFLWLIAGVGLSAIVWNRQTRAHGLFLGSFLFFSFLAVCPGFYFRGHYFILMLPAVSLLAGAAVAAAIEEVRERSNAAALQFLPVLIFAGAFVYPLIEQSDFLFEMDPLTANRSLYAPNPFPEALKIADYLKAHSAPNSRIAILGSEPEIYFYAQRHSATGYIYVYPLMEVQKYASTMQQEMISQIEAAQPEFIVVVDLQLSWMASPGSDPTILNWSRKYLAENYELDGIADILPETVYRWGADAQAYKPTSAYTVRVYKRRVR